MDNKKVVFLADWGLARGKTRSVEMIEDAKKRLTDLMYSRGITKASLARDLKMSPQAVAAWWAPGKRIPGSRIQEIANILDVSVDFLLTGKSHSSAAPSSVHDMLDQLAGPLLEEAEAHITKLYAEQERAVAITEDLKRREINKK